MSAKKEAISSNPDVNWRRGRGLISIEMRPNHQNDDSDVQI